MASLSRHSCLVLTDVEKQTLDRLRNSRTAEARRVHRAQIIWRYQAGESVSQIARALIRALRMLQNKVDTMPRKKHGNIPL